jgi:hypothetical protein
VLYERSSSGRSVRSLFHQNRDTTQCRVVPFWEFTALASHMTPEGLRWRRRFFIAAAVTFVAAGTPVLLRRLVIG